MGQRARVLGSQWTHLAKKKVHWVHWSKNRVLIKEAYVQTVGQYYHISKLYRHRHEYR